MCASRVKWGDVIPVTLCGIIHDSLPPSDGGPGGESPLPRAKRETPALAARAGVPATGWGAASLPRTVRPMTLRNKDYSFFWAFEIL